MLPQGRLQTLDTVRGVAVLGILLLNIVNFAMPEAAYLNPRAYGGWHGADLAVYLINFILFDGKMRGLFSLLFGASMLLVIDRARASGRNPATAHYARMGWLLAFGLAHLWLLWSGDILAHYALVGMLAFGLRTLPVERMIILGILLFAAGALILASIPLSVHLWQGVPANAEEAARQVRGLRELNAAVGVPPAADIARALAEMRSGYLAILRERFADDWASPFANFLVGGPETLGFMLFGMAALRSAMLAGSWDPARYRRWLLTCWGIGIPAYAALAVYLMQSGFSLFAVTLALALSPILLPAMVLGWVCAILLLARPGGALTERLAAAGRMAFTNYLLTSLICTTLFYGYGFGWFGMLSRWQLYPIVLAIWAAILLWSKPWLAHFRFGPLEWLWRSLARGQLQPMRMA